MTDVFNDDQTKRNFELTVDGHTAYAHYRREGATLYIDYVEAPPALRGTGAAGRLMERIVERAKAEGATIVPICSYAVSWMRRKAE